MLSESVISRFGVGIGLCWLPLAISPVSLLLTVGPCGGPNTFSGDIVMIVTGVVCCGCTLVGSALMATGFSSVERLSKIWGRFSLCAGVLGGLCGVLFLYAGLTAAPQLI